MLEGMAMKGKDKRKFILPSSDKATRAQVRRFNSWADLVCIQTLDCRFLESTSAVRMLPEHQTISFAAATI